MNTIPLNKRIIKVNDDNCDDCMSFNKRKQSSVKVLCQLPYLVMYNDYLYCRMQAVNGILAGGVSISKIPVSFDAYKPSIFTRLPKQRSRSCEFVRKSFRRERYSLNCHPCSGLFGWMRFLVDHRGMHFDLRHSTIFTYIFHGTV